MNRGIRVLQTLALPLGYVTVYTVLYANSPEKSTPFLKKTRKIFPAASALPRATRCGVPLGPRRKASETVPVGKRRNPPPQLSAKSGKQNGKGNFCVGAGNEARTRYLHLGKVALYQMSYARIRGRLNDARWCPEPESNQRHVDFQSTALPTELSGQVATRNGLEPSTSSVTG